MSALDFLMIMLFIPLKMLTIVHTRNDADAKSLRTNQRGYLQGSD